MGSIRLIEMDDEGQPEWITVRLSNEEAAFIAKFTGKQSEDSANEVMKGGAVANRMLFETFTGEVFNRYCDGGVDEWIRDNL